MGATLEGIHQGGKTKWTTAAETFQFHVLTTLKVLKLIGSSETPSLSLPIYHTTSDGGINLEAGMTKLELRL